MLLFCGNAVAVVILVLSICFLLIFFLLSAAGCQVKGHTLFQSTHRHHALQWRSRVCRVLLPVHTQWPDPTDPPLQTHLLRCLLGTTVQDGWCHPYHHLPHVPLDYLHPGQPDPARGPVGQHRDLGPNSKGAAGQAGCNRGFERHRSPIIEVNIVSISLKNSLSLYSNRLYYSSSSLLQCN